MRISWVMAAVGSCLWSGVCLAAPSQSQGDAWFHASSSRADASLMGLVSGGGTLQAVDRKQVAFDRDAVKSVTITADVVMGGHEPAASNGDQVLLASSEIISMELSGLEGTVAGLAGF